jgi:hypothetical protein
MARREHGPRAFDDEHACVGGRGNRIERVDDFEHQCQRQRVAPIGAVEHEARDRCRMQLDVLVRHVVLPATRLGGDDRGEKQYAARA